MLLEHPGFRLSARQPIPRRMMASLLHSIPGMNRLDLDPKGIRPSECLVQESLVLRRFLGCRFFQRLLIQRGSSAWRQSWFRAPRSDPPWNRLLLESFQTKPTCEKCAVGILHEHPCTSRRCSNPCPAGLGHRYRNVRGSAPGYQGHYRCSCPIVRPRPCAQGGPSNCAVPLG